MNELCSIRESKSNFNRFFYLATILFLNLVGVLYFYFYFRDNGYLPAPFIYDKSDSFMDLFNPMFWAFNEGRYLDWQSVYPPLNFIFLKCIYLIFGNGAIFDPLSLREDSYSIALCYLFFWLTIPLFVISTNSWSLFDRTQRFLIYIIFILSTPMLFTLERANLIVFSLVFIATLLTSTPALRKFLIALLINIKPYFAIFMFIYFARKDWDGLINCLLITSIIFVCTGLSIDSDFMIFFKNLLNFSQSENIFSLREIMAMPSSTSAFTEALKSPDGYAYTTNFFSPSLIQHTIFLMELIKWGMISIGFFMMLYKATGISDESIFLFLVVVIATIGVWTGGYSMILFFPFVPVIVKMRSNSKLILLLTSFYLPWDVFGFLRSAIGFQDSYLSGEHVEIIWELGLGSLVRPLCISLFMLILLKQFNKSIKSIDVDLLRSQHNA